MPTTDTAREERLDLWRKSPYLTVDEAMNIILGVEPGKYWFVNMPESKMPSKAVPIYRTLVKDIREFGLCLYFNEIKATDESILNQLNVVSYDEYIHSCWWHYGKILTEDLKEWLRDKGFPNPFDITVPEGKPVKADEPNAAESAPQPPAEPTAPIRTKKKYNRGAISALAASAILGVKQRQVQNWDAGINRPDGYPGRRNEAAFHLFAYEWKKVQLLNKQARAMNRPVISSKAVGNATKSAFNDDGKTISRATKRVVDYDGDRDYDGGGDDDYDDGDDE